MTRPYINSSSILIAHDILSPLGFTIKKNKELLFSRISASILGIIAIIPALSTRSLREIIILTFSFYMPIVTTPFILSILGFRSTSKSVIAGMCAGFFTIIIFHILNLGIDSVIPGIIMNLLFLFGTHYILKQKGGWVGIKNCNEFKRIKNQRKEKWKEYLYNIKTFNILTFCRNNAPKNEITYSLFGIFSIVSIYSSMFTINLDIRTNYIYIISLIYHSVLVISTVFLTYPVWPNSFKNKNFIAIMWVISLFYILIFSSGLQVIVSNFGQLQTMIFIINLLILAILTRWQITLLLSIIGIILSIKFFKWYVGTNYLPDNISDIQFKIIYILLLVTATLIAFFKPKQEEEKRKEIKIKYLEKEVDYTQREIDNIKQGMEFLEKQLKQKEGTLKSKEIYLKNQLKIRNDEISKLTDMKDEFLRNITHESNTPLIGIISMCDVLYSCYDQFDNNQIKRTIKDIVNSGDRLKSYVNSIVDLSKLTSNKYNLAKENINLGELAKERTVLYKNIFPDETGKQEFIFNIGDDSMVNCDRYYITQTIDNLISNAVNYGKGRPITISIKNTEDNNISFSISDQGIGIPKKELLRIFEKFSVSSRTATPAGGRGVGLALCKSVIEAHDGSINATSDENGSTFCFMLPKKMFESI